MDDSTALPEAYTHLARTFFTVTWCLLMKVFVTEEKLYQQRLNVNQSSWYHLY